MTRRKPEAPLDLLSHGAASILGRPLSPAETEAFDEYLALLMKWQKSQRLVGSSEPAWIVENLLLDSLLFLLVVPESVSSMLDLGSGAGVPGIPIKIVRPHVRLVLVESRRRRASFLATAVRELRLADTRVFAGRAEDLLSESGARVDAVVMRCAGDLETLLPIATGLISGSGIVVVSGPPKPRPGAPGELVTVEDWARGRPRQFLVYRKT